VQTIDLRQNPLTVHCHFGNLGKVSRVRVQVHLKLSSHSLRPNFSQAFLTMSNNSIRPRNLLLMPDLFYCVLECLVTSQYKVVRQTLAALARTCRAFSEPSLDCLWRRLFSLLPLVRCFANVVDEARVKVAAESDRVYNIHSVDRPLHHLSNGLSSIDTPIVSENSPWGTNIYPCTFCNVRVSSCRI
jgi:hypothetical protein